MRHATFASGGTGSSAEHHGQIWRRARWLVPVLAAALVLSVATALERVQAPSRHAGLALAGRDLLQPTPDSIRAAPPRAPVQRLAELRGTRAEREKLWDAMQAGVAACMAQRGQDDRRVPYDDRSDTELERTRIPPDDVEAARAVGYGLVRGIEETARRQHEHSVPTSSSRSTCLARAREVVYGERDAALGPMSELESEIDAEAASDAAYLAGVDRWRSCMDARHHPSRAPGEAMAALADAFRAGRLSIDQLRAAEIDAAVAEASCYRDTALGDVRAEAHERAESIVLARDQDKAQELRRSLDDALARASVILAGEHGPGR